MARGLLSEEELSTPEMREIQSVSGVEDPSEEQQFIWHLIVNKKFSRKRVACHWKYTFRTEISQEAIRTCIMRTALGFSWGKGMGGGNNDYLCPADLRVLKGNIRERTRVDKAFDTESILEEAFRLKQERHQIAIKIFTLLKGFYLALQLELKEIMPPSRSWINSVLQKVEAKLFYPIFLEAKRFFACRSDVITDFFNKFKNIFEDTHPALFFTTDETMFQLTRHNKVIIPAEISTYFEKAETELLRITGMYTTNLLANMPPIFIILKGLTKASSRIENPKFE